MPVGSISANPNYTITTQNKTKSTLDTEAYMKILVAQLSNQNPLEPVKDGEFYTQLAQMTAAQGQEEVVKATQQNRAAGLIGKSVVGARDSNEIDQTGSNAAVRGVVVGTREQDGNTLVQVKEADGGIAEIKLKSISSVQEGPKTDTSLQDMVQLANSSALIGKDVTAYSPTEKDAKGNPTLFSGTVKKVTFDKGNIMLDILDKSGKTISVKMAALKSFEGA